MSGRITALPSLRVPLIIEPATRHLFLAGLKILVLAALPTTNTRSLGIRKARG